MAEVTEIKIDGYKTFFQYLGDNNIIVLVNHLSQFKAGQRDVFLREFILSAEQAKEAQSLIPREEIWPVHRANYYRNELQLNNFDLEEE